MALGHHDVTRDPAAPTPVRPSRSQGAARRSPTPSRRLIVGAAADSAEREADAIASRVIRRLADDPTRDTALTSPPSTRIRRALATSTVRPPAAGPDGGPLDEVTTSRIRASIGRPLDAAVRTPMERAFGRDLSRVRLHADSAVAGEIGAHAFTVGQHVHLGVGAPSAGSPAGDRLLAHELAHVVQGGRAALRRLWLGHPASGKAIDPDRMTDLQNRYGEYLDDNPELDEQAQFEWMRDQHNSELPGRPVEVWPDTAFTLGERTYDLALPPAASAQVLHVASVLESQYQQMKVPAVAGAPAAGIRLGNAAAERDSNGRTMSGAISATALPQAQSGLAIIARELERSPAYRDMLTKIIDEPGAAVPLLFGKHSAGAFDNWQTGGIDVDDFGVLPADPKGGGADLTQGDIMMHVLEERYYMQRQGMTYVQAHYECLKPDSFENTYRKERGIRRRLVELDECKPYVQRYHTIDDVRMGTFVATDIEGYRTELERFMSGKASIPDASGVQWDLTADAPTETPTRVDKGTYFKQKLDLATAEFIATKAAKDAKASADAEAQLDHWASTVPGAAAARIKTQALSEVAGIESELAEIRAILAADQKVLELTAKRDRVRAVTDLSADPEYAAWKVGYDAAVAAAAAAPAAAPAAAAPTAAVPPASAGPALGPGPTPPVGGVPGGAGPPVPPGVPHGAPPGAPRGALPAPGRGAAAPRANPVNDYVNSSKLRYGPPRVSQFQAYRESSEGGGLPAAEAALAAAVVVAAPLVQAWYSRDTYFANGRRASAALKSLPWYQDEVKKSLPIRKAEGATRANVERASADVHLAQVPNAASQALADLRRTRAAVGAPAAPSPLNDADPGHATLNCSFVSVAALFGTMTSGQAAAKWQQMTGSTHALSAFQDENAWYSAEHRLDPATFAPTPAQKSAVGDAQWAGIATIMRDHPRMKSAPPTARVVVVGQPDVGFMTSEAATIAAMNAYPDGTQFVVFLYQRGLSGGHYVYAERYNGRVVFEDYQWNRRKTPADPIEPRTAFVDRFPHKALTNEPQIYTEACFVALVPL